MINLLPFSRTTEDEEIKFTFNGTFGSPVNFTTFYKETNVLPEVFLRNVDDFNNFQNLWWDYTYSGFDFSNNLVYVGNGLFPTNKTKTTVNGYDNEFDNAYERKFKVLSDYPNRYVLRYNQLMWNNGGFIAGQVTSYANPYIDYENAYFLSKHK